MRTLRRLVSHFKKKRPLHDHRSEERTEMTTNHTRRYQPTFVSRIDSKGSDTLEQLNRQAKRNRTDPFDFNEYPSVGHFFWVKSKIASRFDSNEIVSPAISDLDFVNFAFEDFSDFKLKKLSELTNNASAEAAYLSFHRYPFFLLKWARSKKKRKNFKWLAVGFLLAELLHLIF